ncbi:pyruvate formate lyase family protein [Mollicutes bacterium LVI A0078]|nr:pyruvate formate lyase family protein [Mollicutes bacterium LVI A0075]WOO91215.1 pyruvate formate lyase family protein [Mollicutes bacterium LVI A0078]
MNKKPEGILPFDYAFPTGYTKGREDGHSPITRTNKLRNEFLDGEFRIDSERALLVTDAYKKFDQEPIIIKRAKVLNYLLENLTVHTYEDELIVGNHGAANKHAAIYPEFSYDWIITEMEHAPFEEREFDNMLIDEKTKEDLRSIASYWEGNTLKDEMVSRLDFDHQKASNLGNGTYFLNLYMFGGVGHYVINYERLLAEGYPGTVKRLEEKLATLTAGSSEYQTIEAMLITINGAITYARRYAEKYEEMAKEETGDKKVQFETIASNMRAITTRTPQNIWEAMQLVHLSTFILLIDSNGHSISYGRYDQYLNAFYEQDLKEGRYTKEFIQELIEAHYIKMGVPTKLRDALTAFANTGRGFGGESLTLGGVHRDGTDATNDLTMMCIDATAHTRMMVPWTCVRFHENTPHELKVKTFSVIKAGCGHPKVFNDQSSIESQLRHGRSIEEARDYAVVGCVEISNPGQEFGWHDAAYFNNAKVLELALNDGRDLFPIEQSMVKPGERVGIATGNLADFNSIEEVKEAYIKQLEYISGLMVDGINIMDETHAKLAPTPFNSIWFDNCIETATDMTAGGCKYNHTGPQGSAIGTVADSLIAIDTLVFKEKKYTGAELQEALQNNWEGNEKLLALVNSSKIPHYGNDDDYADEFAKFVFDTYCDVIEKHTNPRMGTYKPGVYGVSSNVIFGILTGPTLDGRKCAEALSDNMGAVHTSGGSHDLEGPTAIANSATKMDHARAGNGTLLNWKFNPTSVSGKTGTENLITLQDIYFNQGGMHSQYNIMSSETMKDAFNNPENYRDMLVRVAGYSAYFVELSKPLQLDLIARTELSFE